MTNNKCDIHSYGEFKANSPELQPANFYEPLLSFTVTRFVKDKQDPSKGVLHFKETPLYYKVQKTNQVLLKEAFGPKPSEVVDKVVTFGVTKDTFKGEEVDAIRLAGSPSLSENIPVTVTYAERSRRKPRKFVLKPTGDVPFYGADADEFKDGADDPKQSPPKKAKEKGDINSARVMLEGAYSDSVDAILEGLREQKWTAEEGKEIKRLGDEAAKRERPTDEAAGF